MKNDKITLRSEDFAKWYTDVVKAARLADYSSVKGFVILEPNGYAIWEKMQSNMDSMFKKLGHQNVYLPVLIPENMLKKEAELVEGFAPEVAWVTLGGSKKLEERLAFRPTSETLFSDYYRNTVKTYRDLPKLYNQWCSVIRWEKETRPFLRTREFLWQEGHTVHATKEEAEEETRRMLEVYKEFFESYLAIPVITGKKTEKEKFAGAEYTLTVESLMQNGVSLQSATSHYFGQKFAKNYDIKFVNKNNEFEYVYQTSWGSSTRMMGALIMSHSDDRGLVLPPKIAPKQVVIIPIKDDEELISVAEKINESLLLKRISSYIDYSDKSAGFKFAEAEVNGVPVRVEIGKRDLENDSVTLVRRDTLEKETIKILKDYEGEYYFQSFSLKSILYMKRKTHKKIGLLVHNNNNKIYNFLINHFLLKTLGIDFISYPIKKCPNKKIEKLSKKMPVLLWTIKKNKQYEIANKYADQIIFENKTC